MPAYATEVWVGTWAIETATGVAVHPSTPGAGIGPERGVALYCRACFAKARTTDRMIGWEPVRRWPGDPAVRLDVAEVVTAASDHWRAEHPAVAGRPKVVI